MVIKTELYDELQINYLIDKNQVNQVEGWKECLNETPAQEYTSFCVCVFAGVYASAKMLIYNHKSNLLFLCPCKPPK